MSSRPLVIVMERIRLFEMCLSIVNVCKSLKAHIHFIKRMVSNVNRKNMFDTLIILTRINNGHNIYILSLL